MDMQTAYNLYWIVIIGIFAQSILAWELGSKGIDYFLKIGVGPKIYIAYVLFFIGVIWGWISPLDFPYKTWIDCWPTIIALGCFIIARILRPKRLNSFLKAKQLYEGYMCKNVRTEPNDEVRRKARNDASLAKAELLYREAIEFSDKEDEIYDVAVASFQLGMLLDLQGRDDEASKAFKTTIDLAPKLRRDVNMIGTISGCYYRLGLISKRKGDLSKARTCLEESLKLDTEINDTHGQRLCKEALGALK